MGLASFKIVAQKRRFSCGRILSSNEEAKKTNKTKEKVAHQE